MALVGANGQGKTTLVRLMLGQLAPGAGAVARHPQAKFGVFAQNIVEELVVGQGGRSALAHLKGMHPDGESAPQLGCPCSEWPAPVASSRDPGN